MKTKGVVALEPHIEKPEESAIFTRFPRILNGVIIKVIGWAPVGERSRIASRR